MDLSTQTPVEIDSRLSDLYTGRDSLSRRNADTFDIMHRLAGDTKTGRYGSGQWKMSNLDVESSINIMTAFTTTFDVKGQSITEPSSDATKAINILNALATGRENLNAVVAEMVSLNAEFTRRGGWTRAFLVVTNGSGHVHSSMNCSTCYPTTQFAWMVDYAAKDESEIITAAGERACTICYPNAPVADRARPTSMFTNEEITAQQARAERAEAKVARDAKKIAKALTSDGSEFVAEYVEANAPGWERDANGNRTHVYRDRIRREFFKTEQAASQWVVQYAVWEGWESDKAEGFRQVIEAMATKHGVHPDFVRADLDRKVAAKIKRDQRY